MKGGHPLTKNDLLNFESTIKETLKKAEKKVRFASNMRLLFALCFILSFAEYFKDRSIVFLSLGIVSIFAFSYFVTVFNQAMTSTRFLETKLVVLKRYEARHNHEWQAFSDTGAWYEGKNDPLSEDLDLFGKNSLYQYLSVAHTSRGRSHLANVLLYPDFEGLKERQEAVLELSEEDDFALSFEALAYQTNDRKRKREEEAEKALIEYAKSKSKVPSLYFLLVFAMPVITLGAMILAFFGQVSVLSPITLILAQIGLTVYFDEPLSKERDVILSFAERVKYYEDRLSLLEGREYHSLELKKMKSDLANVKQGIKGLKQIAEFWQWRENFILYWLLCGIFAWDFNMVIKLYTWKKNYGASFELWLDWIAKIETYLSLGMLGRLYQNEALMPEILESKVPYLEVVLGRHPLLNPQSVVANSHHQEGEMIIITGSNMSGKSTFMRMLGLNTVLAYAGGMVVSEKFVVSPMALFTSMRVRDDVSQGISTFYGEILRVKRAVSYTEKNLPMFVLVDEIFKGTNSKDRIIGAKAAITKLSKPYVMGIVTTHDFELADMVSEGKIKGKNYHFEEHYQGDEICFDYTIKEGRSQSTNAQHLMRIAGLLDKEEG